MLSGVIPSRGAIKDMLGSIRMRSVGSMQRPFCWSFSPM